MGYPLINTISFEFSCSRPVPLYAHLCNQYLKRESFDIHIRHQAGCYFIEAEGEQAGLERLADDIAADFLISTWLTDSKIELIDKLRGSKTPLPHAELQHDYCQHCQPRLGERQSPQFARLDLACDHCHGEQRLSPSGQGLTRSDLQAMARRLLESGCLNLPAGLLSSQAAASQLSLRSVQPSGRERLLICNPGALNSHFHLNDSQILALSSVEKPFITARPVAGHAKLTAPLYDLCFARNRALLVLAELLREEGVDWVYIDAPDLATSLVQIGDHWVEVNPDKRVAVCLPCRVEPLHDDAELAGYCARWQRGSIRVEPLDSPGVIKHESMSLCALHSVNLEHQQLKRADASIILYFSKTHGGQIDTLDSQQQVEHFFSLPVLPGRGEEIVASLEQGRQGRIWQKFSQRYPETVRRLQSLDLGQSSQTLSGLWAIAAVLLDLGSRSMAVADLSDALIAEAMRHQGTNSPRIDYPLVSNETHSSLDWCKTLGTVISFRLAEEGNSAKLAFGMMDSLADFLSQWIEFFDNKIGINTVVLAGSEFSNEVLTRRITLRVGKNFPLKFNQLLGIDSNNYAAGALYLHQRRRK